MTTFQKKTILSGILMCFLFLTLSAQKPPTTSTEEYIRCASVETFERQLLENPNLPTIEEFEIWLAENMINLKEEGAEKSNVLYTIPVVVHIVHNGENVGSGSNISAAQVQSQIDVLNEDFRRAINTPGYNTNPVGADIEIEFCLAEKDENGNVMPEPGIDRVNRNEEGFTAPPYVTNCFSINTSYIDNTIKPNTFWNPNNYFNMWTMNLGCGLLGYAQFPISSGLDGLNTGGQTGAETDGVVVGYQFFGSSDKGFFPSLDANADKGRTATHEVGHWLGLRHIWGDTNASNCGTDYCADTPTQDFHSNNSCPNSTTCDGVRDMVQNYMDYSNDECMNVFTEGQKARMLTVMENSPRRKELQNSNVCAIPVGPPTARFSASSEEICTQTEVKFTDQSKANPPVNNWSWSFPGGSPSTSNLQNPVVVYANPGTYTATLNASNSNGNNTTNQSIQVIIPEGEELPHSENFNNTSNNTWTSNNDADDNLQWDVVNGEAASSCSDRGANVLQIDNWTYNATNTNDTYTNQFDLRDFIAPINLNFAVAYALYDGNDSNMDGLRIDIINPCSGAMNTVYEKIGSNLVTADDERDFVPSNCGEWRMESVDLSAYAGEIVEVSFVNLAAYGNSIYLDDINITGQSNVNLAVDLLSFSAELNKQNQVDLFWSTATEQESSHYIIERSTDGSKWQNVAEVSSNENTNKTSSYTAIDKKPLSGTSYYQLKEVDMAGKVTSLGVVSIDYQDNAVASLYPNPTSEAFNLRFAREMEEIEIHIFDVKGQSIQQQKAANVQELKINVAHLERGIYYVRVIEKDKSQVLKMIKE